jgi:hypothetical protein
VPVVNMFTSWDDVEESGGLIELGITIHGGSGRISCSFFVIASSSYVQTTASF